MISDTELPNWNRSGSYYPLLYPAEADTDPEWRCRLRQDSMRFFRTRIGIRSRKFVKKRIRIYFVFSAVAGVCVVFINVIA